MGCDHSSATLLPIGTVLLSSRAPIGHVAIAAVPLCTNQGFKNIICASSINNRYLFHFLRASIEDFESLGRGNTFKEIPAKVVKEFVIPLPPFDVQQAIARFLDHVYMRVTGQSIELPALPSPLSEQWGIVTLIEELAAKIEEAHGLRQQATQEVETLVSRVTDALLDHTRWPEFPLSDLLRENSQNGLAPRPSDQPPGTPILRISAATSRSDAIVDEGDFKYLELAPQDILKYSLNPGDLLACRFNGNLHYVGRFALYRGYSGRLHVYPDKLIRFRVNPEKVLPEFVCRALNSSKGRAAIESFCATTAGNIGISAANLKTVRFAVPPLSEQHSIVAYMDDLQAKVDALKRLQAETTLN
jgi:type I restriction enzyme S subunit